MTPQSSCKYNGHGFNDDGVCIYCYEDDGTQTKTFDPWVNAKRYRIFGYSILVLKAVDDAPRKFYTELVNKDDAYLASMGSDMPTHWLAAVETYIKRGKLL